MEAPEPPTEHRRRSLLYGRRTASRVAALVFDELVAERAFDGPQQHQPPTNSDAPPPEEPKEPLA